MTGIIKIEISESVEELLFQMKKPAHQEIKERIQALYWLKTQQERKYRGDCSVNRKTQNYSIKVAKPI